VKKLKNKSRKTQILMVSHSKELLHATLVILKQLVKEVLLSTEKFSQP